MVRIINIDTKARTIRVSNGKDDLEWFTTDTGSHVPLKKGQSKAEAIKEHFGDKKQNPQLERLEKMGKAWGKDQMSVLRELGKTNPQGLKDELDRIDSERERTTKAHKEWRKEKAAKQQPAKQGKGTDENGTVWIKMGGAIIPLRDGVSADDIDPKMLATPEEIKRGRTKYEGIKDRQDAARAKAKSSKIMRE